MYLVFWPTNFFEINQVTSRAEHQHINIPPPPHYPQLKSLYVQGDGKQLQNKAGKSRSTEFVQTNSVCFVSTNL